MCGVDVQAKGTWLAVNIKTGMIAFLTNRASPNTKGVINQIIGTYYDISLHFPILSVK